MAKKKTKKKTKKRGKNVNKGGRPTKFTPEVINKLEHAFSIGAKAIEACIYADITEDTFYKWLKNNKKFSERIKLLRQKPVLMARQSVLKHMSSDGNLALKFLERKCKDEFSTRTETVDQSVKEMVRDKLKQLTDDELIALEQKLDKESSA